MIVDIQHDIGRFDISMSQPLAMKTGERIR
jgi:hypothetical protein